MPFAAISAYLGTRGSGVTACSPWLNKHDFFGAIWTQDELRAVQPHASFFFSFGLENSGHFTRFASFDSVCALRLNPDLPMFAYPPPLHRAHRGPLPLSPLGHKRKNRLVVPFPPGFVALSRLCFNRSKASFHFKFSWHSSFSGWEGRRRGGGNEGRGKTIGELAYTRPKTDRRSTKPLRVRKLVARPLSFMVALGVANPMMAINGLTVH